MNDLNFEIRTEAETLCKLVREFEVPPGITASSEHITLMNIVFRLEKLLREHGK